MPFDPNFIPGHTVPLPTLGPRIASAAFDNGRPVKHSRFSLVLHQQRGFAVYVAHNLDGASIIPEGVIQRRDRFRFDPKIPSGFQIDNDRAYRNNPWDRGHLVQRRSLHWGDRVVAEESDRESYYWSNIAPQHERLHDTAWGSIEDWMLEWTDQADHRAAVFTGPVLMPEDPEVVNRPGEMPVQIPSGFWKVMVIKTTGALSAAGFLVWQRDFDKPEPVEFDPFLEQVRVTTLEYLTGLSFGVLRDVDPLRFGERIPSDEPQLAAAGSSRSSRPVAVRSADDIFLPRAYRQ